MEEKISKVLSTLISSVIIGCGLISIFNNKKVFGGLICILYAVVILMLPFIFKKIGISDKQSFKDIRLIIVALSLVIDLIIVLYILDKFKINNYDITTAIVQIIVYLNYTFILFMFKNEDKNKMYFIFGVFYIMCIIISYINESMCANNYIPLINTLKNFLDYNLIKEFIYITRFCVEALIMPIKEAVLTYIIFDSIFDHQDNKKNIENNDQKGNKEIYRENKIEKINIQDNRKPQYQIEVIDNKTHNRYNYYITVKRKC